MRQGNLEGGIGDVEALADFLRETPPELLGPGARTEIDRLGGFKDKLVGWMPDAQFGQWKGAIGQVRKLCSKRREDEEAETVAEEGRGSIRRLFEGYGFIKASNGDDYFFLPRHVVEDESWEWLREGMDVVFRGVRGRRGLRALEVRVVSRDSS